MERSKIHILLIEDDPADIHLLKDLLNEANGHAPRFHFTCASRLDEGIEWIRKNAEGIDVVVLDLALPDSRGLETLVRFQEKASNVPVVILTELEDEKVALEAVSKGAQDYLYKGQLNHYVFSRSIRHAIERHKIKNELNLVTRELLATNVRLEQLAVLDPLTELLNRRGLQQALSRELELAKEERSDLVAVILDLDNFKLINDAVGHAVGDVVLKEIARKIKATLRVTDYVARVGGDEFLALLPRTRMAEGIKMAQKIRLSIADLPVLLSLKESSNITASLGLLMVTEEMVSVDELIAKAHEALDNSKRSGKNRLSYGAVKDNVDEATESLGVILNSLRRGEKYRVARQPIFALRSDRKKGYEFLSRMDISGFEMPDHFFRLCLENNILTVVDYHCLKKCIAKAQAMGEEDMRYHFNIFPSTIIDIPDEVVKAFPVTGRKGTHCVEISEQQIIGDPAYLFEAVNALKKINVEIAIDDVGFGHSHLESLIEFEPDVIKIDKKWVNGISQNVKNAQSLKRLLKVTEALGADVVAEGIEEGEDLKLLKDLGVKYGQGYLLGRPELIEGKGTKP